jgi:hypothetical protein
VKQALHYEPEAGNQTLCGEPPKGDAALQTPRGLAFGDVALDHVVMMPDAHLTIAAKVHQTIA